MPLALVACVDTGDEGIYVLNNTAITGECSLSGSPDQPSIGHGLINYLSPTAYVMTPLIQSRIQAQMNVDDTSRTVQLRGADIVLTLKAVTVEHADGTFTTTQPEKQLAMFSTLFSGSVPPGGTVNAFVNAIPPATLRQIAAESGADLTMEAFNAEVLAQVVIRGEINDNNMTSAPYLFPITVCNDCVVSNLGSCPLPSGVQVRTGNSCNPFQDGVVDCCSDTMGRLVCPAATATM
jgi:hypothetical protein